jgi:hypothetical protein
MALLLLFDLKAPSHAVVLADKLCGYLLASDTLQCAGIGIWPLDDGILSLRLSQVSADEEKVNLTAHTRAAAAQAMPEKAVPGRGQSSFFDSNGSCANYEGCFDSSDDLPKWTATKIVRLVAFPELPATM